MQARFLRSSQQLQQDMGGISEGRGFTNMIFQEPQQRPEDPHRAQHVARMARCLNMLMCTQQQLGNRVSLQHLQTPNTSTQAQFKEVPINPLQTDTLAECSAFT